MNTKIRIAFSLLIIVAVLVSGSSLLSMTGCTAADKGEDLPPLTEEQEELYRGNPKLAYVLEQLIEAKKRGEAEAYAQQYVLKLRDGKVAVEIVCVPSQVDVVIQAINATGGSLEAKAENCKKAIKTFEEELKVYTEEGLSELYNLVRKNLRLMIKFCNRE